MLKPERKVMKDNGFGRRPPGWAVSGSTSLRGCELTHREFREVFLLQERNGKADTTVARRCGYSTPEVGFLDHFVVLQVGGGVLQDDLAGLDDVAAVGDGEGHQGILFHQQDGGAFLVDDRDHVEDRFHQHGRQAHRRLVHQEQARTGHQGAPGGQHLLFTAGESARQPVCCVPSGGGRS